MLTIGKEGSDADLIIPDDVLDFSVENRGLREEVDATLVGDDTPDVDEPDELRVDSHEHAYSRDETYCVCALEKHNAVLLFEEGEFRFKKDVVDPGTPIVTDAGSVVVSGYTEGGYQEGSQLLYVWDRTGAELVAEEFQATVDSVTVDRTGQYVAVHTGEFLDEHNSRDFSVNVLDMKAGTVRARYTDQIPGVTVSGSRRKQIWKLQFVSGGDETYIALFDQRDPTLDPDVVSLDDQNKEIAAGNLAEVIGGPFKNEVVRIDTVGKQEEPVTVLVDYDGGTPMEMNLGRDQLRPMSGEEAPEVTPGPETVEDMTVDNVPADITLIDLNGDIVQKGRPDMDSYPDHYRLTDAAKERLGINET